MMPATKKQDEWIAQHSVQYRVRFTDASGVIVAMEKMTAETGVTASEYLREALLEKLDFDGYIRMEAVKNRKRGQVL
jgi:hypothetical protein